MSVSAGVDKKRYRSVLIAALLLAVFFSGCGEIKAKERIIYYEDFPRTAYEAVMTEAMDEVAVGTGDRYETAHCHVALPLSCKSGVACETYGVVAGTAIENGFARYWYPHYLATVVIAVDRDQTDIELKGWEDLRRADEAVGYLEYRSGPYNDRMIYAALCHGYIKGSTLNRKGAKYIRDLRESGRFGVDEEDAPILVCFDCHVAALVDEGRNLEIVIPEEGTLTFEKGLVSTEPLQFPEDLEERLMDAGLRLTDGRSSHPAYPAEADYVYGQRITNLSRFNEESIYFVTTFRREAMGTHLFRTADGTEHAVGALLTMVAIVLFFGFMLRYIFGNYVRRIVFISGFFLLLWTFLRYAKYQLILHWMVGKYLWYGYYVFFMALPLCLLWLAISVDNPRIYHIQKKVGGLILILYGIAVILVLTNDLHRGWFILDPADPDCIYDYRYGWMYFTFMGAGFFCILSSMVLLVQKAWRSAGWKGAIFPVVFFASLCAYALAVIFDVGHVRDGDAAMNTVIFLFLYYAVMMVTGLIPLNIKHREMFALSPFKMHIVDGNGQVVLRSTARLSLDDEERVKIKDSPGPLLRKDGDTLLYRKSIPGGHVLWEEDVTEIQRLRRQLEESALRIEATNALLAREKELKSRNARREEKRRLLSMLEDEISARLEELLVLIEELPDKREKKTEVAKITTLLCYIKRRSSLIFREKEMDTISGEDVAFYMEEMADFSGYGGVHLMVYGHGDREIPTGQGTLFYDFLYEVLGACMGSEKVNILVQLFFDEKQNRITLLLPMEKGGEATASASLKRAIAAEGGKVTTKALDDSYGIELAFPRRRWED